MQKLNQPTPCQLYLVRRIKGELPEEAPINLFEGSCAPEAKIVPAKIQEDSVSKYRTDAAEKIAGMAGLMYS